LFYKDKLGWGKRLTTDFHLPSLFFFLLNYSQSDSFLFSPSYLLWLLVTLKSKNNYRECHPFYPLKLVSMHWLMITYLISFQYINLTSLNHFNNIIFNVIVNLYIYIYMKTYFHSYIDRARMSKYSWTGDISIRI
jgi:hypothetical protein